MLSLFMGMPSPETFPFISMSVTTRSPFNLTEQTKIDIIGAEVSAAFQYNEVGGMAKLLDWLYGLQREYHGRERSFGWRMSIGCGSQDLIHKVSGFLSRVGLCAHTSPHLGYCRPGQPGRRRIR